MNSAGVVWLPKGELGLMRREEVKLVVVEASYTYAMCQASTLVLGVLRRGQCDIEASVRCYI